MRKSNLIAGLLAILGFQAQSCVGTDEYGCPYTTYKTNGTVKDEKGNKVQGAEISVKADVIVEKESIYGEKSKDTISQPIQTVYSNKKGEYEVSHGDLLDGFGNKSINYEVITNKDGYEPDTIRKEANKSDFKYKHVGDWENVATQEIDITLKKK